MSEQINLKDENYLKSYEEQIRKLPLVELYEVLGIVKKDPSSERLDIVSARIHELENAPRASKPEKTAKPEKAQKEKSFFPFLKEKKKAPEDIPVKEHHGHHHRKHSPKASPLTWTVLCLSAIVLLLSRVIDGITREGPAMEIPDQILLYTMELTPFLSFGVGYLVARAFPRTRKRAVLLGITTFLIIKATLGFFFENYQGFAFNFFDEKAMLVSGIVFPIAVFFTVLMYLRETRKANDIEGLLPLALALVTELGISSHLI